jgi:hypothetical protein
VSRLYDMKLEDMRRELLRFRYDAKYKGYDRRVPLAAFGAFVGVSRQTLYAVMQRSRMFDLLPATRSRLAHGVMLVVEQGVRWRRRDREWQPFLPDGSLPMPPVKRREAGHVAQL